MGRQLSWQSNSLLRNGSLVRILQGSPSKMKKAKIKNIASGIEKNCDILRKNDNILEVVLEGTTIKILLKKKTNKYIGYFKEMEFESDG